MSYLFYYLFLSLQVIVELQMSDLTEIQYKNKRLFVYISKHSTFNGIKRLTRVWKITVNNVCINNENPFVFVKKDRWPLNWKTNAT